MRKGLSMSDLRESVKLFKILVVVNAALLGLTAVSLLWSWSSAPDLARRNILTLNATFGLGLTGNILMLRRYRQRLDNSVGIR